MWRRFSAVGPSFIGPEVENLRHGRTEAIRTILSGGGTVLPETTLDNFQEAFVVRPDTALAAPEIIDARQDVDVLHLRWRSRLGQLCAIEISSDLAQWRTVEQLIAGQPSRNFPLADGAVPLPFDENEIAFPIGGSAFHHHALLFRQDLEAGCVCEFSLTIVEREEELGGDDQRRGGVNQIKCPAAGMVGGKLIGAAANISKTRDGVNEEPVAQILVRLPDRRSGGRFIDVSTPGAKADRIAQLKALQWCNGDR